MGYVESRGTAHLFKYSCACTCHTGPQRSHVTLGGSFRSTSGACLSPELLKVCERCGVEGKSAQLCTGLADTVVMPPQSRLYIKKIRAAISQIATNAALDTLNALGSANHVHISCSVEQTVVIGP